MILPFIALVGAFVISILAIPSIIEVAKKKELFDVPNNRRVHVKPVPRLGGVAIFAGFMSSFMIFAPINSQDRLIQEVLAAITILFFIGLKDDVVGTSVFKKFFVQLFATGVVVFFGGIRITSFYGLFGLYEMEVVFRNLGLSDDVALGISYLLTCIVILGVTNAMNLIDGMDGLAASITTVATISFGYYYYQTKNFEFFMMTACLLGSVLGFLRYNYTKAKIFMGDSGALLCGFLVAVFALELIEFNEVKNAPNISIAIIFLPIFDTIRVAVIRIFSGKSPFSPDKNHVHHVLLSLGLSQIGVLFVLVALNLFIIILTSYLSFLNPTQLFFILFGFALLLTIIFAILLKKKSIKSS